MSTKTKCIPESITLTVSKTVQIRQYEPVTVTLSETHILNDDEDIGQVRNQLYLQIGKAVGIYINKEIERYTGEE